VLLKTLTEGEIAAAVVVVAARLRVTVFCQVLQVTKLPSYQVGCFAQAHVHILVLRWRLSMLKFFSPYGSPWISLWYKPILLHYLTFTPITLTFTTLRSFLLFYICLSLNLTFSFNFDTILQRSLAPIFY